MKLITLDFEGTLVDFQWKLAEAVEEVVKALSKQGIPEHYLRGMNYASIYNFVREKEEELGLPGQLTSLVDEIYDSYDLDAASRWRPVEGLLDTLDRLKEYKVALVSNVGRKALDKVFAKFGLWGRFGFVVTRNEVRLLKPATDGLLKAIDWAGVERANVIHIGDSLSDIEAARGAGVKIGIILGGENEPELLLKQQPDIVLDKLTDLPSALKAIGF